MSTPNVTAFYASIGIELPARATLNATVRCFAQPDAHRHGDSSPSCSVSLASGAWNCHGCGARGGAYDAALTTGHTPRSAMELLITHSLAEPRAADYRPTDRQAKHAPLARKANRAPAPAAVTPLTADEDDIASWAAMLDDNGRLTRRLALERAWGIRVIRQLQIGFDGARITIPVRDVHGALRGVLRYAPFGPRDPKMLDLPGSRLGLIPHPVRIAQKYVVLVEGPPDMIAARSCGLAAIAVPGTSAWQPAWAEQLIGKQVTLVMDCDPPGRAAAAKIAASLSAAGIRVDVVDLAPGRSDGYDLTDRILERRRQRAGPLNARGVAGLIRPAPTVNHSRTRAPARNSQEVAR
jgi:5S rRNA maturation endonuclease (ribonuclease M5)